MPVADGILTSVNRSFATWDPGNKGIGVTLSGGNLTATMGAGLQGVVLSTISKFSSKWYWEITVGATGPHMIIGVALSSINLNFFLGGVTGGWGYTNDIGAPGQKVNVSFSAYGATYTTGDVISNAWDADNGFIYWGKNGTWQNGGVPTSGGAGTGAAFNIGAGTTIFAGWSSAAGPESGTANFGASPFSFSVPSGYNAGLF